jgi:DNA-binding MarR family transcriptional regulator
MGSTILRDGTEVIDIEQYAPFLLNAVGSAWQRKTSAIYRRDFGFGIGDWRVMSMLNIEPGISAMRVCEVLRLDKAAVSRSLRVLEEAGLVRYEASPTDTRKRWWWLSEAGQATHARVLSIALACEAQMMADVTPEDRKVFLKVMKQMLSNLAD